MGATLESCLFLWNRHVVDTLLWFCLRSNAGGRLCLPDIQGNMQFTVSYHVINYKELPNT